MRGWRYWIQGADYPACKRCQKPMTVFFQIDSEENVPEMWGDAGMMYLRQCEAHLPQIRAGLRPGATDAELDALERHVGSRLPEDFRRFYLVHDPVLAGLGR